MLHSLLEQEAATLRAELVIEPDCGKTTKLMQRYLAEVANTFENGHIKVERVQVTVTYADRDHRIMVGDYLDKIDKQSKHHILCKCTSIGECENRRRVGEWWNGDWRKEHVVYSGDEDQYTVISTGTARALEPSAFGAPTPPSDPEPEPEPPQPAPEQPAPEQPTANMSPEPATPETVEAKPTHADAIEGTAPLLAAERDKIKIGKGASEPRKKSGLAVPSGTKANARGNVLADPEVRTHCVEGTPEAAQKAAEEKTAELDKTASSVAGKHDASGKGKHGDNRNVPPSRVVHDTLRGGPVVREFACGSSRAWEPPTTKYAVCFRAESQTFLKIDEAIAACDKIAERVGRAEESVATSPEPTPAPKSKNTVPTAEPEPAEALATAKAEDEGDSAATASPEPVPQSSEQLPGPQSPVPEPEPEDDKGFEFSGDTTFDSLPPEVQASLKKSVATTESHKIPVRETEHLLAYYKGFGNYVIIDKATGWCVGDAQGKESLTAELKMCELRYKTNIAES